MIGNRKTYLELKEEQEEIEQKNAQNTPYLSPEELKRLKDEWFNAFSGIANAHKVLLLSK